MTVEEELRQLKIEFANLASQNADLCAILDKQYRAWREQWLSSDDSKTNNDAIIADCAIDDSRNPLQALKEMAVAMDRKWPLRPETIEGRGEL